MPSSSVFFLFLPFFLSPLLIMLSHGIGLYLALARHALKSLKLSNQGADQEGCGGGEEEDLLLPPLPLGLSPPVDLPAACPTPDECLSIPHVIVHAHGGRGGRWAPPPPC